MASSWCTRESRTIAKAGRPPSREESPPSDHVFAPSRASRLRDSAATCSRRMFDNPRHRPISSLHSDGPPLHLRRLLSHLLLPQRLLTGCLSFRFPSLSSAHVSSRWPRPSRMMAVYSPEPNQEGTRIMSGQLQPLRDPGRWSSSRAAAPAAACACPACCTSCICK